MLGQGEWRDWSNDGQQLYIEVVSSSLTGKKTVFDPRHCLVVEDSAETCKGFFSALHGVFEIAISRFRRTILVYKLG